MIFISFPFRPFSIQYMFSFLICVLLFIPITESEFIHMIHKRTSVRFGCVILIASFIPVFYSPTHAMYVSDQHANAPLHQTVVVIVVFRSPLCLFHVTFVIFIVICQRRTHWYCSNFDCGFNRFFIRRTICVALTFTELAIGIYHQSSSIDCLVDCVRVWARAPLYIYLCNMLRSVHAWIVMDKTINHVNAH